MFCAGYPGGAGVEAVQLALPPFPAPLASSFQLPAVTGKRGRPLGCMGLQCEHFRAGSRSLVAGRRRGGARGGAATHSSRYSRLAELGA